MGVSSAYKLCTVVLLWVALCYGKDHHTNRRENSLDVQNTTEFGVTPVLQHAYYFDDIPPRAVIIVSTIVTLLIIGGCVYFCCRCRSTRSQGLVIRNMAAPAAIVIQQTPNPYPQQPLGPKTYPQEPVPPPYDTQPYPQQQFQAQTSSPTAFTNPNYAPQPPVNLEYGQEKY